MSILAPIVCWGCNDRGALVKNRSLPAPIAERFPYELKSAQPTAIWAGDQFQIDSDGTIHYYVLRGVEAPKPGQDFFLQSRQLLTDLIGNRELTIVVCGVDDHKREIANVVVDDIDVNLAIIAAGMAWYNRDIVDGWEQLQQAEQSARDQKKGLWQSAHPVRPSDFFPNTDD